MLYKQGKDTYVKDIDGYCIKNSTTVIQKTENYGFHYLSPKDGDIWYNDTKSCTVCTKTEYSFCDGECLFEKDWWKDPIW